MIDEIELTDVALIETASIVFDPKLTVITGETGAGKSALLSGIKLLVGERADVNSVREGSERLAVSGRFFDSPSDLEGHVVMRRVGADGRSRISIDGKMATVSELAQSIGRTVDLCGQHQHQMLLRPTEHRNVLDTWLGDEIEAALDEYQRAFSDAKEAHEALDALLEARKRGSEEHEKARFTLTRIGEVNPAEGELEELESTLKIMEHAEVLASASNMAHEALSADGGALELLINAMRELERAGEHDERLAQFGEGIDEVLSPLEDISRELASYATQIDFDPSELSHAQERLSALLGLVRSFGPRMEDVFIAWEDAKEVVASADATPAREQQLREKLDLAEKNVALAAKHLSEIRKRGAKRFSQAGNTYMDTLEMAGASLLCEVLKEPRDRWTAQGADKVEFLYSPAKDARPKPFNRIASGGEMSRVMLSVKAALGERDQVDTLVFDEVDAGVGGHVARAVGSLLKELSNSHQVICVTHLAQVAVYADVHYLVKRTEDSQQKPVTEVLCLDESMRTHEIARMLSGEVSEASLAHAQEMLTGRLD